MAPPVVKRRSRAEQLIRTWVQAYHDGKTKADVARTLGVGLRSLESMASKLRRKGVNLPSLTPIKQQGLDWSQLAALSNELVQRPQRKPTPVRPQTPQARNQSRLAVVASRDQPSDLDASEDLLEASEELEDAELISEPDPEPLIERRQRRASAVTPKRPTAKPSKRKPVHQNE